MKRVIGILMLIIGFSIIIYPSIKRHHDLRQQDKLLQSFDEAMDILAEQGNESIANNQEGIETNNEFTSKDEIPDFEPVIASDLDSEDLEDVSVEPTPTRQERNAYIQSQWPVEAKLMIEKIDLVMPVINQVKSDYLDVALCAIEETSKPWEQGNYAIAGHRSLTYGRHFNRLNEVSLGDHIVIKDLKDNTYEYEVFDILIVHERDVSVLEDNGFKEITLITCDPIGVKNPDNRLIVKGKLSESLAE